MKQVMSKIFSPHTLHRALVALIGASAFMGMTEAKEESPVGTIEVPEDQKISQEQIEKWYQDAWAGKVVADELPDIPYDIVDNPPRAKKVRFKKDLSPEEIKEQQAKLKGTRNFGLLPKWQQDRLLDSVVVVAVDALTDIVAIDLKTGQYARAGSQDVSVSVFLITPHSITKPVPPVEGKIGSKPLFPVDEKLYAALSEEDKLFFKTLSQELSRNVAVQARLHVLDIDRGDEFKFAGQILDTDFVVPPKEIQQSQTSIESLLGDKTELQKQVYAITGIYYSSYRDMPTQRPNAEATCSGYTWQSCVFPEKVIPSGSFLYNKSLASPKSWQSSKIGGGLGIAANGVKHSGLLVVFAGTQYDAKRTRICDIAKDYTSFAKENGVKMGVPPKSSDKYTPRQTLIAQWGVYLKNYQEQILTGLDKLRGTTTETMLKYARKGVWEVPLKFSTKAIPVE